MPRVIIMRHGEAESRAASDAQRNLTEWGKKEAHATGRWLLKQGVEPDAIIASPYNRAQQTADIMRGRLGFEGLIDEQAEITPNGDPNTFLETMSEQAESLDCVLYVSHNPLVTATTNLLVDGDARSNRYVFATASLAIVDAEVIAAGLGNVVGWFNPEI